MQNFGPIVEFHRRQAGLSQAQLALIAGVGKTAVFDLEKGKQTVRFLTLSKVLQALNIKLEWNSPLKALMEAQELEQNKGKRQNV